MKVPFIDLNFQTEKIREKVLSQWNDILDSSSFVLSEELKNFEENFSDYSHIKYSTGVGNGGDAIELLLRSLHLSKNSTVYLPVNTFIATATAVSRAGYKIKFVDINQSDGLMNYESLFNYKMIEEDVVIPVHLFGSMVDVQILKKNLKADIKIIEDASQAHGARFRGRSPGKYSYGATYSFYPGKNLGAFGDGGLVNTSHSRIDKNIKLRRNYGSLKKYKHDLIGFNSRLDPLQAIVLNEKLKYLDDWNLMRKKNFEVYKNLLSDVEQIQFLEIPEHSDSVFHLTVIKVNDRQRLINYLQEKNISTIIHYPYPLHKTQAYSSYKYKKGEFIYGESLANKILSLPNYPGMTDDKILYVCSEIKKFYEQ